MARPAKVERPTKRGEYSIRFASVSSQRGWTDLCATIRNALAARIWFYVHEQVVYLEQVHTRHPNATK